MTITAYSQTYVAGVTTVTVTSSLAGTVYFHWYADGTYLGATEGPSRSFFVEEGEQLRVEVVDTTDADFDPVAGAPAAYPARRTLWWCRSIDADVDHYRIEEQVDGGDWSTIGLVPHDDATWQYELVTERLDDLADYAWRVVPVDRAGNDGTAIALRTERVVRTPDAPDFTATFDPDTTRVTFTEDL